MYLPVPLFGYLCDRYSPQPLSLLASFLFGSGYLLAAFTYRAGPLPDKHNENSGWPFWVMIISFVGVGAGTSCMYLAAVATCAKNYAKAEYRGFMLAVPIAAFGLSGMWQSQIGDHLLSDRLPDGRKGEVNVFKFFVFLAILLITFGVIGTFCLRIVDEEEIIENAVEDLERSGLLDQSQFFNQTNAGHVRSYGAISNDVDTDSANSEPEMDLSESLILQKREEEALLNRKKTWILNHSTHNFLTDRTMWLLAAGFFLVTGPGEAYINNLGTIIPTLTPPKYFDTNSPPAGYASTHVSIIALTSTFARLFTGTLSDLFAPPSQPSNTPSTRVSFSRMTLLLPSAFLLLLAFLNLALPFLTPAVPPLFHLSSALLGLGYGASFSLVPIIISVVWGVENFATNWGIVAMTPAGGAAVWSIVYSIGYSRAADELASKTGGMFWAKAELSAGECRGYACFGPWAWGSAISVVIAIVLWSFAWRTWRQRNVVV